MTTHESDDDGTTQESSGGRKGRTIALWSVAGVAVLAAAYVGLAAWKTGTIPEGTTVAGVKVGGLTQDEAQAKLDTALDARRAKPIVLDAEGKKLTLHPAKAGLSFDSDGALDGLAGFSLNPATVLDHLTSGPDRRVDTNVDEDALTSAVHDAGQVIKGAPVNGSVTFDHGTVKVKHSQPGTGLNTSKVVSKVAGKWPGTRRFSVTVSTQPAPLTNATINAFARGFAKKAMSDPVTVKAGERSTELTPTMISGVLSTKVKGGKITPVVDQKKLDALLDKMSTDLVTAPVNAKVSYAGGEATVTPAKKGTTLKTDGADTALLKALKSSDRTMTLKTAPVAPEVTTKEVKAQVKQEEKDKKNRELVSKFVSPYPTGPQNDARTHNIKVALKQIDGTYVAPGEQFSLLKALTPITAANGYVDAPVLVGGVDVPGMGGGISQVSTTLYNATFFAGLQLDEHTAHGYWISRYPMGREATLWVPTIDNKWTNDSGHGITIKAYTSGNAAVIELYGRKVFTVTSHTGKPFNIVAPKTRVLHTANCMTQPPVNGFDVTVTRVVKRGSKVVKNESLTTHYNPADRVICK